MIDHVGLAVSDIARSKAFYAAALAPLGYAVIAEETNTLGNTAVMMGVDGEIDFIIADGERVRAEVDERGDVSRRERLRDRGPLAHEERVGRARPRDGAREFGARAVVASFRDVDLRADLVEVRA